MNIVKSEDKEKRGISLRKKRTVKPKISAPKQISGPLPINASTESVNRSKVSLDGGQQSGPRPRARPQNGDATADLIQRRYSTRFANLPPDFNALAPSLPSVPKVPNQFAVQPPSRDGLPSGPRVKVDVKALSNPNLKPDQCRRDWLPRSFMRLHHSQMYPPSSPMPRKKPYRTTNTIFEKQRTGRQPISRRTSSATARNLSRSVKRQRSSRARCEHCAVSWPS
jgi:hypothetical protein